MPPPPLFYDFMDVIQNTSAIWYASYKYKVQYRIIKNLLTIFETPQHSRIRKEKKLIVESINHIQITRWAKYILYVKQ